MISVVHRLIHLAFAAMTASSSLRAMARSDQDHHGAEQRDEGDEAEQIGDSGYHFKIHLPLVHQPHDIGQQTDDAEEHNEGVVIDIAGLGPDQILWPTSSRPGGAVRPQTVDDLDIETFQKKSPRTLVSLTKVDLVDLVEVPLVDTGSCRAGHLWRPSASAGSAWRYSSTRPAAIPSRVTARGASLTHRSSMSWALCMTWLVGAVKMALPQNSWACSPMK